MKFKPTKPEYHRGQSLIPDLIAYLPCSDQYVDKATTRIAFTQMTKVIYMGGKGLLKVPTFKHTFFSLSICIGIMKKITILMALELAESWS
jgi:hypothetical protein